MKNSRVREDGVEIIFRIIRDKKWKDQEVPRMKETVS
jgi:hypothetical protein